MKNIGMFLHLKKNIHRLNLEMCYKNKIFGTDFIVHA